MIRLAITPTAKPYLNNVCKSVLLEILHRVCFSLIVQILVHFDQLSMLINPLKPQAIHRIHKWRTRGKKLVPSHESEALEGKQKLQMKTFSELAECLARIPPKITLYGRLFKYNDVGRLLLFMLSTDLLFAIKRGAYIFKETG